jgi:hypothetical protein
MQASVHQSPMERLLIHGFNQLNIYTEKIIIMPLQISFLLVSNYFLIIGDDLYLIRLIAQTGPSVIGKLNEGLSRKVLAQLNRFSREPTMPNMFIDWMQSAVTNSNKIFYKMEKNDQNELMDSLFNIGQGSRDHPSRMAAGLASGMEKPEDEEKHSLRAAALYNLVRDQYHLEQKGDHQH